MLEAIPAWHIPHEWATIGPTLARAIERDPLRDVWAVLDQAMSCDLDFWRVGGSLAGYLVTQVTAKPRTFWIIYVAGRGGSIDEKRELMTTIEDEARKERCREIKFEGRDWRFVFPDYSATQSADGRWHFRKVL